MHIAAPPCQPRGSYPNVFPTLPENLAPTKRSHMAHAVHIAALLFCAVELEISLIFEMAFLLNYITPLLRIPIPVHMVASVQHVACSAYWQVF